MTAAAAGATARIADASPLLPRGLSARSGRFTAAASPSRAAASRTTDAATLAPVRHSHRPAVVAAAVDSGWVPIAAAATTTAVARRGHGRVPNTSVATARPVIVARCAAGATPARGRRCVTANTGDAIGHDGIPGEVAAGPLDAAAAAAVAPSDAATAAATPSDAAPLDYDGCATADGGARRGG